MDECTIIRKLDELLEGQRHVKDKLHALEKSIMALADDLKAGIAALETETDVIAALLTKLAGMIKNSMTDQEVADVKAALTAESTRLTSLGVDPTNPVPPVPATLAATRKKV